METCNYNSSRDVLIDIQAIPDPYRNIFSGYPSFNRVQSTVFHDVLYSDQSITISAPTGSGKTAIFELAIVRQLIALENCKYSNIFKIVHISPMKALCEERLIDWHKKFSSFGLNCISITGDSEYIDFGSLSNHNLIITTPEKWDCITRKWRDNMSFMQAVKLFMIDEIHLLNEEIRGATLEALVCRMKTIQSTIIDEQDMGVIYLKQNIRFLAASATFPNIKDAGEWLYDAKYFSFEDSIRPVKLKTIVLGYTFNKSSTPFKFDITLNYKLPGLIMKYSDGKPTLIFCSTRKSVEMAVKHLTMTLTIPLNNNQKETLRNASSSVTDSKLKTSLLHGIGYHHGGLLPEARAVIEQLFRAGILPVLITTSTLATGVNLPAHLVIIKSTKFYDNGGFQDYTAIALLQMLGRAGRPQFDNEATALILTSTADKEKFENMTDGKKAIESNLHKHLTEHLNAEIVLGTITGLDVAMRWLSSTFLYIRARQNPRHYGIAIGLTSEKIDKKLLEVCKIDLNKLVKAEMATMDEDINIKPTNLGELMAKYYMSFETMKLFKTLSGNEILQQILSSISKCQEFSDMRLRVDEKKCLNLLNKNKNKNSIRFPFSGKIKTIHMKINCTIQAVFGCLEIEDNSILTEAFRIMRLGERICRCLIEYWKDKKKCYSALLNTIILWKCFHAQLWENSPHIAKQFPGIGSVTSNQLVNAGKTSLDKIISTNPREIEMITKKKPPFGNKVIDIAKSIPRYDMTLEKINQNDHYTLKVVLDLLNPECLQETSVVGSNDIMSLLVGDSNNNILLYERYMHSHMLENNRVVRMIPVDQDVDEVHSHFISENIVGIDLNEKCVIKHHPATTRQDQNAQIKAAKTKSKNTKGNTTFEKLDEKYVNYVQTYIDNYLKCKKNYSKNSDHEHLKPKDGLIETCVNESRKESPSDKAPNSSTNTALKEADAEQMSDYKNIKKMNPPIQLEHEAKKFTAATADFYNLSPFDEKEEIPQHLFENAKEILSQTSTPVTVVSLTDAEIAEYVEIILDGNQKDEQNLQVETEGNTAKLHEERHTENEEQGREIINFNIVEEFAPFYEKYKMDQGNVKVNGDRETPKSTNYSRRGGVLRCKLSEQKKGKIHSAESFEDTLLNPNTESLSAFRFKPNKRFSHNNREVGDTYNPQSKRRKSETYNDNVSEDMMKNLEKYIEPTEKESQYAKSIKWRSPLVHSPAVKYSPKISNSFSFSIPMPKNNDFESSHDWSLTTQDTNSSSNNMRTSSYKATPRRMSLAPQQKTRTIGTKFLIADKEYENVENEELNESSNPLNQSQNTKKTPRKTLQLQDIVSTSFLDDIGLTKSPRITPYSHGFKQKPKSTNDLEMTVGNYYHDLMTRSKQSIDPNCPKQITRGTTPFFLNQNTTNLLENDSRSNILLRKSELNPDENNFKFGQSYYRKNEVPRPQKSFESEQQNTTLPLTQSMEQHYPNGFWVSNNHQYYNPPQNQNPYSQQNRQFVPMIPSSLTDFPGFIPSHPSSLAQMKHFNTTHIQNRQQKELKGQELFHETTYPKAGKEFSNYIQPSNLPSGFTKASQGLFNPHNRAPLNVLDRNVISTQEREMQQSLFPSPNNLVNTNGRMNLQTYNFGSTEEFLLDVKEQEYEKENHQFSGHEWKNYSKNMVPQSTLEVQEHNGFFLNEYPSSVGRCTDNKFSSWNTPCLHHRLFNCPMCKAQPYPPSFNADGNPATFFPQNAIYPVSYNPENYAGSAVCSSYPAMHGQNAKPSCDQSGIQYFNTTNCHQLSQLNNESYVPQLNQQVTISDGRPSNSYLVNGNSQGDPSFFQNGNFSANYIDSFNGLNSESFRPREMRRVVDNPNEQGDHGQPGNKTYLLDKFLDSCENSKKTNQKN